VGILEPGYLQGAYHRTKGRALDTADAFRGLTVIRFLGRVNNYNRNILSKEI
jgi:hypothetical protein